MNDELEKQETEDGSEREEPRKEQSPETHPLSRFTSPEFKKEVEELFSHPIIVIRTTFGKK